MHKEKERAHAVPPLLGPAARGGRAFHFSRCAIRRPSTQPRPHSSLTPAAVRVGLEVRVSSSSSLIAALFLSSTMMSPSRVSVSFSPARSSASLCAHLLHVLHVLQAIIPLGNITTPALPAILIQVWPEMGCVILAASLASGTVLCIRPFAAAPKARRGTRAVSGRGLSHLVAVWVSVRLRTWLSLASCVGRSPAIRAPCSLVLLPISIFRSRFRSSRRQLRDLKPTDRNHAPLSLAAWSRRAYVRSLYLRAAQAAPAIYRARRRATRSPWLQHRRQLSSPAPAPGNCCRAISQGRLGALRRPRRSLKTFVVLALPILPSLTAACSSGPPPPPVTPSPPIS